MTERAITEAKKYVERSLKSQERLGYRRPKQPVVKAAVNQTAEAVDALLALQAAQKNRR
jgi:hypothetical protein